MKITYFGTTTLLFDDGTDQLLFDCHVTRTSILTSLTGKLATNRNIADRVIHQFQINRLGGIFVSHSHYDHVLDAPYVALRCHAPIYGSPSTLNVARGGGVGEEALFSYGDSMAYQIGAFRITVLPSVHSAPHWYNNDLGQTIDKPLVGPARKRAYKEGGSYDFLVSHRLLVKFNREHDDLFYVDAGAIRPTRKLDDLIPFFLRKDRIAEIQGWISEVDAHAAD